MHGTLLLLLSLTASAAPLDLTDVAKVDFSIRRVGDAKCVLRRNAADALSAVAATYRLASLSLKVTDCYHPKSGKQPVCGDHSRGDSVDVSVVDRLGVRADNGQARLAKEMRRAGFVSEGSIAGHFVFTGGPRPESDDVPISAIK